MKVKELQNITNKRYSSRKKQLEIIQTMAEQITVRTGVYGIVVIEEDSDCLMFGFDSRHYGKIRVPFTTEKELEEIKEGVFMSFHEAENIHYRISSDPKSVTEKKIGDANSLFEKWTKRGKTTYEEMLNEVDKATEREERWYLEGLLEIHSYYNKGAFVLAYAQHCRSIKNFDRLRNQRA